MSYEYIRKVNYYETDMMGIVHHSNYIRWFEEARIEFLGHCGLPYRKMEDEGIMIPVVSVDCRYKTPAKFGDEIIVKTTLVRYNSIVMELTYEVINKASGDICVTGNSSHCFVNSDNFKPISLKKERPDMDAKFNHALEV